MHAEPTYYHNIRSEIQPLIIGKPKKILEVGAGAGSTLQWLKSILPGVHTTGVEINEQLQPELCKNADVTFIGPIEEIMKDLDVYDLILCLDVLEHLTDPLGVLRGLCARLAPGSGQVIVSLPNVAHLSVSLPLLFGRRFTYQEAGILDRTHLRFFTETSVLELLNGAGLIATAGVVGGLQGPKSKIIDAVSFGILRHHLTKRYIVRSEPAAAIKQPRIEWQLN